MDGSKKKYVQIFILSMSNLVYTLPYLATTFYTQFQEGFGFTNSQVGQLIGWYGATAIFGYLFGGWISDKFSPKKLVVASCFSTAALGIVISLGISFPMMQAVYLLFGISTTFLQWGSLVKFIRLLGDENEQGKLFGVMEMSVSVVGTVSSYVIMAALGLIIQSSFGFRGVFIVFGLLLAIVGLAICFFVPIGKSADSVSSDFSLAMIPKALTFPVTWFNAAIVLGLFIMQTGMTYMNPYLSSVYGVPVLVATNIAIFNKNISRLFLAPLGGVVRDKMKSTSKFLSVWIVVMLGSIVVMMIMPQKPAYWVMAVVLVLVFGSIIAFLRSGLYTPVAEAGVDPAITGTVIGIVSCIGYSSDLWLYNLCGGWIDTLGNAGYLNVMKLYMAGGIMALSAAIGFGIYMKRKNAGQSMPNVEIIEIK